MAACAQPGSAEDQPAMSRTNALEWFATLTAEEVVARCQAEAALNDAKAQRTRKFAQHGGTAHKLVKGDVASMPLNPERDFKAGCELADRLIREKGGEVPVGWTVADIADAHQRALARRAARVTTEYAETA